MKIESYKCPECGGNITEIPTGSQVSCSYCGALLSITDNAALKELEMEDGLYSGEATAGVPHGYGKMSFRNGDRYVGNWKFGKMDGEGILYKGYGTRFEGKFYDGKRMSGKEIDTDNKVTFEGSYRDDQQYEGKWLKADGSICKEGLNKGQAKINFDDGSVYEGETNGGELQGKGKYTDPDGTVLTGEWEDSLLKHADEIKFENGACYKGNMKSGRIAGYGTFWGHDGSLIYADDWADGRPRAYIENDEIKAADKKLCGLKPWLNYNNRRHDISCGRIDFVKEENRLVLSKGYDSAYFSTDLEKMCCELEHPYILVSRKRIVRPQSILILLEKVVAENSSLLIVSDEVVGDALTTLIVNKLRGTFKVCSVSIPNLCENAEEVYAAVCNATGAKQISEYGNVEYEQTYWLGTVSKVIVDRDSTSFIV